jgi:hypothetical protein
MNRKKTTSRKDFFKHAGLGLAGLLGATTLAKASGKSNSSSHAQHTSNVVAPKSALERVRPATGTVQREVS